MARAGEVAAEIEALIERGQASQAVPLARRVVERVTSALMYLDDSPGIVGDQLRELMLLYARACAAAPLDAARLAAWLAKMQLDGGEGESTSGPGPPPPLGVLVQVAVDPAAVGGVRARPGAG